MRQKFIQAADGMISNAAEHVAEPGERICLHEFARRNKAAQHGRGPASVVAPEESPVIPSDREAPRRPLGPIVIDGQIAIAVVTRKRV